MTITINQRVKEPKKPAPPPLPKEDTLDEILTKTLLKEGITTVTVSGTQTYTLAFIEEALEQVKKRLAHQQMFLGKERLYNPLSPLEKIAIHMLMETAGIKLKQTS